jgi:hypothetical protein
MRPYRLLTLSILSAVIVAGCAAHGSAEPTVVQPGALIPQVVQTGQQAGWQSFYIPSPVTSSLGNSTYTLVAGLDGAIWGVIDGGVIRVDMSGHHKLYALGSSFNGPIANNYDADIFVAGKYNGTYAIAKISPDGDVKRLPIPGSAAPVAMISGSDGNLWMTRESPTSVGRLTPSGVYTDFGEGLFDSLTGIIRGADKNLWVEGQRDYKPYLARFEVSDGSETTFTLPVLSCWNCMTTTPDGTIWIPQQGSGIYEFDLYSQTGQMFGFAGDDPSLIVAGPNKRIYYESDRHYDVAVCEYVIKLHGQRTCLHIKAVHPRSVEGMTVGPDGQIWVAVGKHMDVAILHFIRTVPTSIMVMSGSSTALSVSERRSLIKTFSVTSNDMGIATVSGSGESFSVTGVSTGSTTLTVTDGIGNSLDLPVTVQ